MEEDVETAVRECLTKHASTSQQLADIVKDGLSLQSLDGGFLNQVFRATSSDESKSCIVKVYRSFAKKFGRDSAPLESERSNREAQVSEYLNGIVPGCCPVVLVHDEGKHIVCFEDLRDFTSWRTHLLTACDLKAGAKLADTLVTMHSSSHRLKVGEAEFDHLKQKFGAFPQQTDFLCQHHFVKPFSSEGPHQINADEVHESIREKLCEIRADPAVLKAVALAKEWMNVGSGDCCIHGDLHADSILFKEESIKIIDVECARIGPPAFDVALLVCNYVLLYHFHQHRAQSEAAAHHEDDGINHNYVRRHILDLICITLSRYMDGMGRLLGESFDRHQVWKQLLLFLGVEVIAWISGPPTFAELKTLPEAQLNCLNTALRILHKQSLSLDTQDLSKLIHS